MSEFVPGHHKVSDSYPISDGDFPETLVRKPQWIVWKPYDGKGKVPQAGPLQPEYPDQHISAHEPDSWLTFNQAKEWISENPGYGIGFTLSDDDPFVLIDIDDCRDPDSDEIHPKARELIDESQTWADVSVSGTGIHLLGRGEWNREYHKTELADGVTVEVYDSKQYAAMSGVPLNDSPDGLTDIQGTLDSIPEPEDEPGETSIKPEISENTHSEKSGETELDIDRRIQAMLDCKNGEKYRLLWKGNYRKAGFSDRSTAEQSLISVLTFFMDRNERAIREAMNRACREYPSGRKWSERTGIYRDETVNTALETVTETYSPGRGNIPYQLRPEYSNPLFRQVHEYLLSEGYGTTKQIADSTDRGTDQAWRVLSDMADDGLAYYIPDGRSGYWYILESDLPDRLQ